MENEIKDTMRSGCVLKLSNYSLINTVEDKALINEVDDLEIERGQIVFLKGNNGSGKTSLLNSLFSVRNVPYLSESEHASCKIEHFEAGSKECFDLFDKGKDKSVKMLKSISLISQEEYFDRFQNVIEALSYKAETAINDTAKKGDRPQQKEKIKTIKEQAQKYALEYLKDIYIHNKKYLKIKNEKGAEKEAENEALRTLSRKSPLDCSGGQKRLITVLSTIIKAKVMESDILAMDEPLNFLDPKNKKDIVDELTTLYYERKKSGNPITYIIVSHCLVFTKLINEKDEKKKRKCISYTIDKDGNLQKDKDKVISIPCLDSQDKEKVPQ